MEHEPQPRSWTYRRRAVFITLAGCFAIVGYIVVMGDDNAMNRSIAEMALTVIMATVAGYVGGGTLDDWLKDKEANR